jgi:glycerol 3-phosphatase-2
MTDGQRDSLSCCGARYARRWRLDRDLIEAEDIDGLIIDLDGVVWLGNDPIPGSARTLNVLINRRIPIVFLTNDPLGSPDTYAARLSRFGVPVTGDQILTSGSVLASAILDRHGYGATTYVVGSPALKVELERAGLLVVDGANIQGAAAVAVGAHGGFNYDELRSAAQAVHRGAKLYAAGRDATFPMPDGPWPATGAVLAAIETAANAKAVVVGKPETPMFELAQSRLTGCERVAVVGDSLGSDILGAARAGLFSILVLTGTSSLQDLNDWSSIARPDVVVSRMADLVRD